MRDIVLFLGMLYYLPITLVAPAAGLAIWEWISLMSPHRLVYGFAYGLHLNFVVAVTTLIGWGLSQERKRFTPDGLPWVLLAFFAWSTLNMLFAPYPDFSWPHWNLAARSLVPVFLVFVLMNRKARMQGLVWVVVISLGYYGVKGGLFTILTGGNFHVFGPPATQISDNNKLALALVMGLPLLHYLSKYSKEKILRNGLRVAFFLQMIAVFGSYSRGAILALGVMAMLFWMRSKNKLPYAALAFVVVIAALTLMPAAFTHRLDTLHDVSADSSFEGRVRSWHVAYWYANDHFPFGAGFDAPAISSIYNHYYPDVHPLVAHSIYFEVLGDQGYPGLALYLLMLLLALRNASIVMRRTRDRPELAWAGDLARMLWVSIISFCVGGAALSIAYYDGFLILLALTSCLREVTAPQPSSGFAKRQYTRLESTPDSARRTTGIAGPVRQPEPVLHQRSRPDRGAGRPAVPL